MKWYEKVWDKLKQNYGGCKNISLCLLWSTDWLNILGHHVIIIYLVIGVTF